jgi:hypothetical protein
MGGNGGMPQSSSASTTSVSQALEIARDSPEGARDPVVREILERAIQQIWLKVQMQPTSYVMNRVEFGVFNYFQSRFIGNEVAIAARKRYWDHASVSNGT